MDTEDIITCTTCGICVDKNYLKRQSDDTQTEYGDKTYTSLCPVCRTIIKFKK